MWDLDVCLWAGFAHLLMLFHMMEASESFTDSHFLKNMEKKCVLFLKIQEIWSFIEKAELNQSVVQKKDIDDTEKLHC